MRSTKPASVLYSKHSDGDFSLTLFHFVGKLGIAINEEAYVELESHVISESTTDQLKMYLISRGVFGPEAAHTASVLKEEAQRQETKEYKLINQH